MIVPIAANLQASRLEPGRTVLLNENMVVVSQLDTDTLGAVLKNIVDRAKTYAVKLSITTGQAAAIGINLLAKAVDEEYGETRDALLDADPEQWSRINGLEPGRVTGIRPVA